MFVGERIISSYKISTQKEDRMFLYIGDYSIPEIVYSSHGYQPTLELRLCATLE